MSKKTFTIKEDEILIQTVRMHEPLYNTKHKEYRKTWLKEQLWAEIATKLNNKTGAECLKRWCYVRDYYIRRKSKLGNGTFGEAAKRRAQLLSFLDFFSTSQTPISYEVKDEANDDDEDDSDEETDDMYDGENIDKDKKNRKKSELNACTDMELDEIDLFFSSMAKIVKRLPRYEQAQLRMHIGHLVGNTELKCMKASQSGAPPRLVAGDFLEVVVDNSNSTDDDKVEF